MNPKLILLVGCLAWSVASATEQISADEAFSELKELVGNWEGKTEDGRPIKVSFRLTANDSVLMETWALGPQRESLTLYHMDNKDLIATHYCPVGNQPRLKLKAPATASLLSFQFVSATNLPDAKKSHQHQFEIEPLGRNSFARSETYMEDGEADTERIVYTRVVEPAPQREPPAAPAATPSPSP